MPPKTQSFKCNAALKCGLCAKQFSSFMNLKKHERLYHGLKRRRRQINQDIDVPVDSPLRCSYCHKIFYVGAGARRHEKTCPELPGEIQYTVYGCFREQMLIIVLYYIRPTLGSGSVQAQLPTII